MYWGGHEAVANRDEALNHVTSPRDEGYGRRMKGGAEEGDGEAEKGGGGGRKEGEQGTRGGEVGAGT